MTDDILEFADASEWEAWLEHHHAISPQAWLRIGKKGSQAPLIGILDAALVGHCFGWIDGQRRSLDGESFLQRYCPRRKGSSWSQVNVERVESLIAQGRMRPPGLAEVQRAKADGRWAAAYERQATAQPPDDLLAALAARPGAMAMFEALSRTDRYALILRVLKTRSEAGRGRTIDKIVEELGG